MNKYHQFVKYLLWIMFLLLCGVLLRLFVFELCYIRSNSMEDTMMVGDCVVISKLNYGGLFPRHLADIPLVNLLTFCKSIRDTDKWRNWGYGRAPGFGRVKRGDIIIFIHPKENSIQLVKRCVALPGDTIRIENGLVLVNGCQVNYPSTVKLPELCDTGNIIEHPYDSTGWTLNNFGTLVVPAQRMTLALDSANVEFYRNLILLEGHELICFDAEIYVDGIETNIYTFKADGYFVLGDHRNNSLDSRYFGIVPGELIIGKAVFVYFSTDLEKKEIRWKRIGKLLK